MSAPRYVVLAGLVATLAAVLPLTARANGDPASDFLVQDDTFIPFDDGIPSRDAEHLDSVVHAYTTRGFQIKVALVGTAFDLGSVTALWRQPQHYADFLGQELASFADYHGRLLVVMPNGYGFYYNGQPGKKERRLLDSFAAPGQSSAGATAAAVAVRRLAGLPGVQLNMPPGDTQTGAAPTVNAPSPAESHEKGGQRLLVAITVVVTLLGGISVVVFLVRRRRSR